MKKVLKTVSIVMVFILISKAFGFFRDVLVSNFYGTSVISDQYAIAISTASLLTGWLINVSVAEIPIYQSIKSKLNNASANQYIRKLVVFTAFISIIVLIILGVSSKWLLQVLAPGLSTQSTFYLIMFFSACLGSLISILSKIIAGFLNCEGYLVYSHFSDCLNSFILMISALSSGITSNSVFLQLGFLLGAIIQLGSVLFVYWRLKYPVNTVFDAKPSIIKTYKLSLPSSLSSILVNINDIVDKHFASLLTIGTISAIYYSNTIITAIYIVLSYSIGDYIYPKISEYNAKNDFLKATLVCNKIKYVLLLICIPVTIYLSIFSTDIIQIIFFRGQFDQWSLNSTSVALAAYCFSLVPLTLRHICIVYVNSRQKQKAHFIIGVFSVITNLILDLVLYQKYGLLGISLCTSITTLLTYVLYELYTNFTLHSKLEINSKFIIAYTLILSSLTYALSLFLKNFNSLGTLFVLFISFICLAILSIFTIYLFDKNTYYSIKNLIVKKR